MVAAFYWGFVELDFASILLLIHWAILGLFVGFIYEACIGVSCGFVAFCEAFC